MKMDEVVMDDEVQVELKIEKDVKKLKRKK